MSTAMMWRPVRPQAGEELDYRLKKAVARRWFGHDGSLAAGPVTLRQSDLPYLQGLADAGIPDAQTLMQAVGKFEAVEVWLEA